MSYHQNTKSERHELLGVMEHMERGTISDGNNSNSNSNSFDPTDPRAKMQATTARLNNTTDTLTRTQGVLQGTIQQGADIMVNLSSQGETIKGAIGKLDGVNDNIGQGRRYMREMNHRLMTNKLIVAGVIAILVLVIIVVIVFKWS